MSNINWRTINIDAFDPESCYNFDLTTLTPAVEPISTADVQTLSGQIRQLLRGGDTEGALRGALENAPYGADEQGKVCAFDLTNPRYAGLAIEPQELLAETLIPQAMHLSVVIEVLGQIRQAEMTPMLQRMYQSEGGSELCDTLMKYLYKGMAQGPSNHPSKSVTSQATGFSQAGGRSFGGAESGGQHMSVLLSWHEKLIEMVGPGSIVRAMSDRRTV